MTDEEWLKQRKETQERLKKEIREAEIINRARADKTRYIIV